MLAVLLNLCTDYEPAQHECAKQRRIVAGVLAFVCVPANRALAPYSLGTALQLLALLVVQLEAADVVAWTTTGDESDGTLRTAPATMVRLAVRKLALAGMVRSPLDDGSDDEDDGGVTEGMEVDDVVDLCSLALSLLAFPALEAGMISAANFAALLAVFEVMTRAGDEIDPDVAERFVAPFLRNITSLSGRDDFAPLSAQLLDADTGADAGKSTALSTLFSWLRASPPLPPNATGANTSRVPVLATAACIALGNMARSDDAAQALVERHGLHVVLVAEDGVLRPPPGITIDSGAALDPQLTHAALSLLRNLAVATRNRAAIGSAGDGMLLRPDGGLLARFWAAECTLFEKGSAPAPHLSVQVRFAAVGLARLLLTACGENVAIAVETNETGAGRSFVDELVGLFDSTVAEAKAGNDGEVEGDGERAGGAQMFQEGIPDPRKALEPVTAEAARALAAVLKVLHSHSTLASLIEPFYAHHKTELLAGPLRWLLVQKISPALRSTALFTLGLLSRASNEGSVELVQRVVNNDKGRLALSEAALAVAVPGIADVSHAGEESVDDRPRRDRENALFIVAQVIKRASDMSNDDRAMFEGMLVKGSDGILAEKESLGSNTEGSST